MTGLMSSATRQNGDKREIKLNYKEKKQTFLAHLSLA